MSPKSEARELSIGSAETVMSACGERVSARGACAHAAAPTHPGVAVLLHKVHVVHAVQVVAWRDVCSARAARIRRARRVRTRQDDDVLHILVLDVRKQPGVLAHGVSGALEPLRAAGAGRLRGGQDLRAAEASAIS
jgi:hypothetical protein